MAQNQFMNLMAGIKLADGSYVHQPSHASASASDMTISWDSAKFTTKGAFIAAMQKALDFIKSRTDLAP